MLRRSCPAPPKLEGDGMVDEGRGPFAARSGGTRLVVSQGDLESVASLFGRITALRQGGPEHPTSEEKKDEGAPLDAHVRVVMRTMKERLASLREAPLQDAEVIMAKHGLYSICFQELILVADAISPGLSCALEGLRDAHHDLVQDVPGIVQRTLDGYQQEISCLRADKVRETKEAGELVQAAQALERETVAHHQELTQLHLRLNELEEENDKLKKKNSAGHPSFLTRPRTPLHKTVTNGFAGATTTSGRKPPLAVADLSTTLYDGRGGGGEGGMTHEPSPESVRTVGVTWNHGGSGVDADGKAAVASAAVAVNGYRELSLKQLHDLIASVYASKEKYDRLSATQRLPNQTMARHLDDFLVHRHGLTSMARAQAAALRNGMERFRDNDNAVKVFEMTLRSEVDERFRLDQRDTQRAIFDLIRSRIRERTARHDKIVKYDDRYSYRRLGGTSISRIAAGKLGSGNNRQGAGVGARRTGYFSAGAAAASTATIESLLRSQTRPSALLAAADWQTVVQHVYKGSTTADAQTVEFLVKDAATTMRQGQRAGDNGEPGSGRGGAGVEVGLCSVPFGLFLQVLLGYQLHGYLRRLKVFREEFREVDVDGDGVLNPVQFLALAKRTLGRVLRAKTPSQQLYPPRRNTSSCSPRTPERNGPQGHPAVAVGNERPNGVQQQAAARLRAADPHGFGVITFSQCVLHLTIDNG